MPVTRRRFLEVLLLGVAVAVPATAIAQSYDFASGWYTVEGLSPDGSSYVGTANIQRQGDSVFIRWDIAGQILKGHGTLHGQVLTVDRGEASPVVYVVQPNGTLQRTWSNGRASEKLTLR